MKQPFALLLATALLTRAATAAVTRAESPLQRGSGGGKKKLAQMGEIMFKALQSVLVEKKQKELLAPAPRRLSKAPAKGAAGARELRENKLTKRVTKMLKDKIEAKLYNRRHRYAASRLLNKAGEQPLFKPVYISQYPRIMTLVSTATNIVNLSENVMGEDAPDGATDLKEIFSAANHGLRVYREIRGFIDILFFEQAELSLEIDSFFYNCDKILIGKEELLRLLALEKYYENAQKKCDTAAPRFQELDNELLFQTNDFLDKIRRFLLGIDNLRNAASFMSFSVDGEPAINQDWAGLSHLEKIQSGANLTEVILRLKAQLEVMLFGIRDGVNKGRNVRSDVVKILREMYKLIPLQNEGAPRLSALLCSAALLALLWAKRD